MKMKLKTFDKSTGQQLNNISQTAVYEPSIFYI